MFIVLGAWAAVGWLCGCLYLIEDEPAVWAVPEGPVVGSVLPGVPPVHESLPDCGEAGVADDLAPGVGVGRLAY